MTAYRYPFRTVGILGGGQLGRMLIYEALKLGLETVVLDPAPDAPCARPADVFLRGSLEDEALIRRLASLCDVVTWEIEHVNVDALEQLSDEGFRIQPKPSVLRTIQDKLTQKEFLHRRGLPVARYQAVPSPADDETAFRSAVLEFGLPSVQKARRGGYDGRGVAIIGSVADLEDALVVPSIIEEKMDIETEIAVNIARSANGSISVYPIAEMRFSEQENICTIVAAPGRIEPTVAREAVSIARRAVLALEATGIIAVEMFVTRDGQVLINEIAPRPHNSGHLTIEACVTNQFEQHLRAILGWPLGDPSLIQPAAMANLLAEADGGAGTPVVLGLEEALAVPGASLHLYGKSEARPFRKMGHVTVVAATVEEAIETAEGIRATIKIEGGADDRR